MWRGMKPNPNPDRTMSKNGERKGHIPVALERANWHRCTMCGMSWSVFRGKKMPDRPGAHAWKQHPLQKIMYKEPCGSGLMWNGIHIHRTHQLVWLRGLIFCPKCGCYSSVRVRTLSLSCCMKPPKPGTSRHRRLICMKKGKRPTGGK